MRTLMTLAFTLAFAASTLGSEPATAPAGAGTPAGTAQGTGGTSGYDTTVYQLKHARAHAVLPNISRQLAQKVSGVQVVLLPTTADDALVVICPRQQTPLVKQAIEACDVKRQYAVKVQLFEIADDGNTIPVAGPSLIVGREGTLQCSTSPDELVTLSLKVGQPAPSIGGCILPNPPEPVATLGAAAADPSCCAEAGNCCSAAACGVGSGICPVCDVCGGVELYGRETRCQNQEQCGKDCECHAQAESKCKCSEACDQCNDADASVAEQADQKKSANSSEDQFAELVKAYNKAARDDQWSDALRIAERAKQLNCNNVVANVMRAKARVGILIARNKSLRTNACPGCEVSECGNVEPCGGTADCCADGKCKCAGGTCKSESAKACGNCCEEAGESAHETAKGEVAEGPAADECPIAAECECAKSSKKDLVKREIEDLIEEYNRLVKQDRFAEAEMIGRQAKELDPHDPVANLMVQKARLGRSIAVRNERFRERFEALLNEFCPASYEVRCGDGGPAANEVSKADVSKAPGIDESIADEANGTAKPSQDAECQCPATSPRGQSAATSQSTASSGTICGTISGPLFGHGAMCQIPTLTRSWSFNPWFTAPGQGDESQNGVVLSPARFGFTIRLFGEKPEACGSIRVSDGQVAGTCQSNCEANGQSACDRQCPNACAGSHCEPPALLSLQNLNLDTLLLPFWQNELLEWYRTCRLSEVFNAHNPPDSSSKSLGRLVAEFPKLAAHDNHPHAHGLIIVELPDRIRVFEGAPPAAEIAKSPAGVCPDCREEFSKFLEEIFRVPSMAQEINQVGHSEVEPATGDAPRDLPSVEHSKIETTVVTYPLHDLVLLDDAGRPVFDTCTIIDHIQTAVAPETWFHPSVSIQLDQQSVSLVIRQTPEVHAKIEDHLRYLRRLQVKQLCNLIERISVDTRSTTGPAAQHKPAAAEPKNSPAEGAYDVLQGINPN